MFRKAPFMFGLSIIAIGTLVGCGTTSGQQPPATNGVSQQNTGTARSQNGFGRGQQFASLSKVLGIPATTMMNDLKAGESLAQIAQAKGVSQQKLISAMETSYKTQLDQAVSSGRISSSQEQQMISHYDGSLPNMIQQKGMMGWSRRGSGSGRANNSTT